MSPLAIIDPSTIDTPENADEALGLFIYYAEPGDVVTLHDPKCPTTRDSSWKCRCVPQTLTIGARA